MLRDDVLIENSKYGYIIMQNNGAIANVMHEQMAETIPAVCDAGYEAKSYNAYFRILSWIHSVITSNLSGSALRIIALCIHDKSLVGMV